MERQWERIGGIGGILFAALSAAAVATTRIPGGEDSNADVAAHFADEGSRVLGYVSAYLFALAGIAFLMFLGGLWQRLRRVEPEGSPLLPVALGAGLAFVAMLFVAGIGANAVAATIQQGGEGAPGADAARLGWIGTLALCIYAGLAAAACVGALAALILRTRVLPRWLGWAGVAAAVVLLGSVMFMPLVALPLWTLAAGVGLLGRAAGTRPVNSSTAPQITPA